MLGCTSDAGRTTASEKVPLWLSDTAEPYPFTTPVPPLEATPIDGTYVRRVTARMAGSGSVPCRRCAPYRIEVGRTEIVLDRGRYLVAHVAPNKPDSSQFQSRGHFVVENERVVLFNDANCPKMRGTYEWQVDDGVLRLEVVEDECPFSDLRMRFLTATTWERSG